MEIRDIIKTDEDRVFIVDPECFIIFTGDSTDDIKPFIRIGTWAEMPVEAVPLIENIIITDGCTGNPAHEQFNIDVRSLPENRYIGSRAIMRRYLSFQKIFNLDLTNASLVDIEKDLPDLSREKNISHKNQFLGVFYRDGNFKTLLNKKTLFNLHSVASNPLSIARRHDLLSRVHGDSVRYNGSGLVVAGHNPIFYHRGELFSYLFPARYLEDFSLLGIDPGRIQAIIHPSANLINLVPFFKWLDANSRPIRVFTDHASFSRLAKLFPHCGAKREPFSGMRAKRRSGVEIAHYPESFNIRIAFEDSSDGGEFTIAFIKGAKGAEAVLRDRLDAIVVSYSAFEKMHPLFASCATPFAVIDDGNPRISRLAGEDRIPLVPGMQYEFRRFRTREEIESLSGLDTEALMRIESDPQEAAASITGASTIDFASVFNTLAVIRARRVETRDRKISSRLASAAGTLSLECRKLLQRLPRGSMFVAGLWNGSIILLLAEECAQADPLVPDDVPSDGMPFESNLPGTANICKRIAEDRERFIRLISLYLQSERYQAEYSGDLEKLREAIEARRTQSLDEALSLEGDIKPSSDETDATAPPDESTAAGEAARGRSRKVKMAMAAAAAIILIAAGAVLLMIGADHFAKRARETAVQSRSIDERFRPLAKQHGIIIRDADILRYANRVAVKNGYHPIAATKLKDKNPDWIYPDNIFIMLDGQRVIVSKGDTLWNLSRNKLIEATLAIDAILEALPRAHGAERQRLIEKASRLAYTDTQKERLKAFIGEKADAAGTGKDGDRPQ